MTQNGEAATADLREIIESIYALHGIRVSEAQARAMLTERRQYGVLAKDLAGLLRFEDEPAHWGLAVAGRVRRRAAR